jgi:hypothetical protein
MSGATRVVYPHRNGGYFMTQDDQDVVIGRLVREHREADELIAKLDAEATRLGQAYSELGQALMTHPEGVLFPKEGIDGRFAPVQHLVQPSLLNADKLKALATDYRTAFIKREQLTEQLKRLGYDVLRH